MEKLPAQTSSPTTSTKPSTATQRLAGDLIQGDKRELINRLSRKAEQGSRAVAELPPEQAKAMAAVWARMKSIYGHLWSSNFKDENQMRLAQAEWLEAFRRAGLMQADVHAALDICGTRKLDMPNLPAFIEIAKTEKMVTRRRASDPPLLPETPEQAEQRKQAEAAARAEYHQRGIVEIQKLQAFFKQI